MSDHSPELTQDRFFYFKRQEIVLGDFESSGLILDFGGGGEGIIGRLKGRQVIAIDSSRNELEEAPPGPLKIIMDARNLQFLDCSFDTATSFFTLMYIRDEDHQKVFQEAYRVLTPGGRFLIWEPNLPTRLDEEKDIAAFPIRVRLSEFEEVNAGYGTSWPGFDHDPDYYSKLAVEAGFTVLTERVKDQVVYLELQRPHL
jgi:SAM-dependent methyltransferase